MEMAAGPRKKTNTEDVEEPGSAARGPLPLAGPLRWPPKQPRQRRELRRAAMFYLRLTAKPVTKLFKVISKAERRRPKMGDGCFFQPGRGGGGRMELAFTPSVQALLLGRVHPGHR